MDDAVVRAQAGDRRAFDELYEANAGRVYALCLRMTADAGRAAELTQDVFVRAWRRIGTFRGDSAFSTWLHRITVNRVLDDRKWRSRQPAQLSAISEHMLVGDGAEDPDVVGQLALERAIAALPARARMALVLHAVEGYRYEEVARLMDVSVGTVKSHIHRARALLIERLEGT